MKISKEYEWTGKEKFGVIMENTIEKKGEWRFHNGMGEPISVP